MGAQLISGAQQILVVLGAQGDQMAGGDKWEPNQSGAYGAN